MQIVDRVPKVEIELRHMQEVVTVSPEQLDEIVTALKAGKVIEIMVGMGDEYQVYIKLDDKHD